MELLALVTLLALLEYLGFVFLTARARARSGVKAPAIAGDAEFERTFRVQSNTIEQLIVFLPAAWLFGYYINYAWAAVLGVVFVIGRGWYAWGYVRDAARRGPGFGLTLFANIALVIGALTGAIARLL